MTNLELYIGDKKMELGEDTIIALTKQVNNLGELKDRQTDFTNTFSIPKSKINQENLESSDNINSTSDKPYQKISNKIVRDGIEIVQNGIAIINNVKYAYEIVILSGNANFFEEIGDKKLADIAQLDNTLSKILWTRSNILIGLPAESSIFFPILDRGVFNKDYWEHRNQRFADTRSMWPAIFVHNLVTYIVSEAGFNKAGDYLDSVEYKKLIVPYVSIYADDEVRGKMATWRNATYQNFHVEIEQDYIFHIDWDSATKYDPYTLIKSFKNIYRYFCPSDGIYKFKVEMRTYVTDWHGPIDYKLKNRRGQVLDVYHIDYAESSGTFDFDLEYEGDFFAQDSIYVIIEVELDLFAYDIQINALSKFIVESVDCTYTGFECQVPCINNLPDITQKELLKALAWMHCLLFITDNITKTVHFIKFSDVIKNKRIAYDWSDKLDLSKDREPELKFKFGKYGQTNYLKYKEDEDVELGLGDDSFTFDDKTLPLEKTLIEMPFAATESKEVLNGIIGATIKCQSINKGHILDDDDVNFGTKHSPDGWRWYDSIPGTLRDIAWYYGFVSSYLDAKCDQPNIDKSSSSRILAVEKVTDVGDDIKFYEGKKDDYTGENENINIAYFIHPSYGDISFNGLIDDHYQEFVNTMNKPKVLTAYFKLSPIDILQFNFAIPVWIDYYQSYFYVNKIEEYQGEITKVELIKI